MADPSPELMDFLENAAASLRGQGFTIDAFERPAALDSGKNRVLRVELISPDPSFPGSVVLKRVADSDTEGMQDWACQFFLSDTPATRGVGPEFFSADPALGFFLMEDLGLGQDARAALNQDDSRGSLAASLLACNLASLHAGTWGREAAFNVIRADLLGAPVDRKDEQRVWDLDVQALLERVGLGADPSVATVIQELRSEYLDPAEYLCLTHGDLMDGSVWYGDAGPRLLNFKRGAYRHALVDLVGWAFVLGPKAVEQMEKLRSDYLQEIERLNARWSDRFEVAAARILAWLALGRLARGLDLPRARAALLAAATEPDLQSLAKVANAIDEL